MARPATGQVVKPTPGQPCFALRFRAYSKRQYLTLGRPEDGWTVAMAQRELAVVLRDVDPSPSRVVEPVTLARLASAPLGLFFPIRLVMELLVLEFREVFVWPVETADAFSATTMVTKSSTLLARTSRPRSARRDDGDQSEPG